MTTPDVTKAQPSERDRCIAAQVLAFSADPLLRWMLPDAETFQRAFPRVLEFYGGRAFEHGSAYRTADFAGSAMWLPPGIGPDEENLGAVMAEAVDPARLDEVYAVLEAVGAAHPDEPHWFLPAIGVDPIRQGRGYGSALLRSSLEVVDKEQKLAYLEASNTRNVPLYQAHGFDVVGEIQIGSSPLVIPMIRKPR